MSFSKVTLCFLALLTIVLTDAEAARKKRKRRYLGPPPTHPVVLWSRTLLEGTDQEQRQSAAYKMSQYSQPIFQQEAVRALSKCIKDPDTKIKVWCAKAMGRAGTHATSDSIRSTMLEQYKADPILKDTLVRAFIARQDESPTVQEALLESLKKSENTEEQITLLSYFEKFGAPAKMLDTVIATYKKSDSDKVKMGAVAAVANRAQGQDEVIALLSQCATEHGSLPTPLVLTCLSGLQQQAKKDSRTWLAVEKTLESDDADVVYATLDLINALPESQNEKITQRLLKILGDVDDDDTLERAILAIGVTGNSTEEVANALQAQLENRSSSDGVRIATALVLGKQAAQSTEKAKGILSKCSREEKSQSLKTACQLGLQEIEARAPASKPNPEPGTTK